MHRGARRRRKKKTAFKSKSFICDRRSIAMSSACQESDMASYPSLPLSSSAAAKERSSLGRQLPGTIFVHDDSWQWGSRVTPRRRRSGLVRGLWRLIGSKCLLRLWRTALHLWSTKPPCSVARNQINCNEEKTNRPPGQRKQAVFLFDQSKYKVLVCLACLSQ